jgi:hypothetical protein
VAGRHHNCIQIVLVLKLIDYLRCLVSVGGCPPLCHFYVSSASRFVKDGARTLPAPQGSRACRNFGGILDHGIQYSWQDLDRLMSGSWRRCRSSPTIAHYTRVRCLLGHVARTARVSLPRHPSALRAVQSTSTSLPFHPSLSLPLDTQEVHFTSHEHVSPTSSNLRKVS